MKKNIHIAANINQLGELQELIGGKIRQIRADKNECKVFLDNGFVLTATGKTMESIECQEVE